MNHEGPTDVLSFPMLEHGPVRRAFHLGEIVVSFDTAREEAAAAVVAGRRSSRGTASTASCISAGM